jgi:hypothetical protein
MYKTRRAFVLGLTAAASALATGPTTLYAQRPITPPPPPQPAETPNPAEAHPRIPESELKRARLLQNQKEFRQGVERLYQLTSDLRDELRKTSTAEVFSVGIVKKTEEIEKLAKLLKSKAKSN